MAAGVSTSTLWFTKYGFQVLFECEFFNTQPSSNSSTQAFSFCEFLKSCSSSWSHELKVYVFANGRKECYTKKPYPSDDTEVYLFWWDWFTSWDELKKNYSKAVNITLHCQLLQLIIPVHTQTHNHQFWVQSALKPSSSPLVVVMMFFIFLETFLGYGSQGSTKLVRWIVLLLLHQWTFGDHKSCT